MKEGGGMPWEGGMPLEGRECHGPKAARTYDIKREEKEKKRNNKMAAKLCLKRIDIHVVQTF